MQQRYIYTGVQWLNISMGNPNIYTKFCTRSLPQGDGKDLGHALEFKSEIQIFSIIYLKILKLVISYNHVSNASLGDKNPGANSYMFNFLKNF